MQTGCLLLGWAMLLLVCADVRGDNPPEIRFVDVAEESGLSFEHQTGAWGGHYLPETMGGGICFFDYDGDGRLDIYAVNGAPVVPAPGGGGEVAGNALFRQTAALKFEAVGVTAGVDHAGVGMGCAVGDYDNDGDADLLVTNYGPDILYNNNGAGRFKEVAVAALHDSVWSTSAAFGDIDRDGDLDLYVVHYVKFDPLRQSGDMAPYLSDYTLGQAEPGELPQAYPRPGSFPPNPDLLLRNDDGQFVARNLSIDGDGSPGRGMGVVVGDCDLDGWLDLYVANDGTPNFFYHNQGNGFFRESGAASGTAYGLSGQTEAGMGVDFGDYDNDGYLDLTVTNFQGEPNDLYRNEGYGFFANDTYSSGMGWVTTPLLGFGTNFLDFDNDGWLDLFVANGHVLENVERFDPGTTYPQRNLLFRNEAGQRGVAARRFTEMGTDLGPGLAQIRASRGTAVADWDADGDLDLLVSNLGGPLSLLNNEGNGVNRWLGFRLRGRASNRDAVGARLCVHAGKTSQCQTVGGDGSYLSYSSLRLHFGLGDEAGVDSLRVWWPAGGTQHLTHLAVDQTHVLREPATGISE